jgi:hypothetical protein
VIHYERKFFELQEHQRCDDHEYGCHDEVHQGAKELFFLRDSHKADGTDYVDEDGTVPIPKEDRSHVL